MIAYPEEQGIEIPSFTEIRKRIILEHPEISKRQVKAAVSDLLNKKYIVIKNESAEDIILGKGPRDLTKYHIEDDLIDIRELYNRRNQSGTTGGLGLRESSEIDDEIRENPGKIFDRYVELNEGLSPVHSVNIPWTIVN
jgi:hypothetical protein